MASRQDQLQSYQFTVQRTVSALVMRDPDPVQPPLRRVTGAALVGVLLATLGLAGAAVYGVLAGGSGNWRDPGPGTAHRGRRAGLGRGGTVPGRGRVRERSTGGHGPRAHSGPEPGPAVHRAARRPGRAGVRGGEPGRRPAVRGGAGRRAGP